jgi:uncharacterized membrane protein
LGSDLEGRLRALEEQLAGLTARIYRIERTLAAELPPGDPTVDPSTPLVESSVGLPAAVSPASFAEDEQSRATSTEYPTPFFPSQTLHDSKRLGISSEALESIIGGQWLNRLGVVAVLVGLSYFLKLAIENNWIGPAARVAIGLAAGIGLLFWSERFRRRGFAAFSYSLKALGLGALYLSLWAAFQLYQLIPASSAFLAMVLVTMAAGTLSIIQESELLAGLALLGGFLTPILVSTHENREVSLLSYLLLLDIGAVWVVASKGWIRLLPGALAGTVLLFAEWGFEYYSEAQLETTAIFATLFFFIFAVAQLLTATDAEAVGRWATLERTVLVLNASAYFIALFAMMEGQHRRLLALLTCVLACVCVLLGEMLRRSRSRSELETVYLILAIAFVTIAVPIQFDGRWITFFWGIEAAALLWLSGQTWKFLLRLAGAVVLLMAIRRLIMVDSTTETLLVFNPRFALYLLTVGVAALLVYVAAKDRGWHSFAAAGVVACIALPLFALSLELRDYFVPLLRSAITLSERHSIETTEAFSYSALWMVYGAALMMVGFWKRQAFIRWLAIALLVITTIKVFFVDISLLQRGYRIASFIALGVILLAVSFFYQRARLGADRAQ